MSRIESILVSTADRASRCPAPAAVAADAALLALCAKFNAIVDAVDAFGHLVNDMPPDHDQAAACMELDGALSRTVNGIALQIARSRATTPAELAAKARIVRYAAENAADEVKDFHDGGAVAIALARSLLADLEAA